MKNNNQVAEVSTMMVIDGLNLDRVSESMNKINQFQKVIQSQLVEGHDFGAAFFGSSKPSLLKPGAEKILMLLGFASQYEIIEQIQNYEDGFFAYTIRCVLTKNGQVITEGLGHCNSKEKKYESDKQDKYMLGNTCLKMAKKRAQVDAALTVGSLSNIFTQDLEDMVQFNQSERMETMNNSDAGSMRINFGKYKGKTLGVIVKEDKGYVEWLKDNARDEPVKQAAAMVLNPKVEEKEVDKKVDNDTGEIKEESNAVIKPDEIEWANEPGDIPTDFMGLDDEDLPF